MTATDLAPSGTHAGPRWRDELSDVVRAVSGGLLFGVPLLYTMEVWWIGSHTDPAQMLAIVALLTVPVFALNRTGGFRSRRDVGLADAAADTVEAVAIGIVVTGLVLVLLREVTLDAPLRANLGKVLYEAIPFCIGISLARHFLQQGRDEPDNAADDSDEEIDRGSDGATGSGRLDGTLADVGATALGAVFVALSIAPTDEIPLIASVMTPAWLLVVMAASLLTSYAIVFVAGFFRQDQRHAQKGFLQRPETETVACYLIAVVIAAGMLWVFQRGLQPWEDLLARALVLGLPATIGGAAGRLAL